MRTMCFYLLSILALCLTATACKKDNSGGGDESGTNSGAQPIACEAKAQDLSGDPGATHTVTCPSGCGDHNPAWGTDIYSDDSSICTAAIHAGLITPAGGGQVSVQIRPGQDAYAGTIRGPVRTQNWGRWERSFSVAAPGAEHPTIPEHPVYSCTGNAQGLDGNPGTTHTITCQPGCSPGTVWGTEVYTDDSAICTAAVHAGVIQAAAGGPVEVRIQPGRAAYTGSAGNGITTLDYPAWGRSFTVVAPGGTHPEPAEAAAISCVQNAQGLTGGTGTQLTVACPAGCGAAAAWGNDVYSDDSSVCTAAIHAGVIRAAAGGPVRVTIGGAQPSFPGSERNGVTTQSWAQWPRSFTVAAP